MFVLLEGSLKKKEEKGKEKGVSVCVVFERNGSVKGKGALSTIILWRSIYKGHINICYVMVVYTHACTHVYVCIRRFIHVRECIDDIFFKKIYTTNH